MHLIDQAMQDPPIFEICTRLQPWNSLILSSLIKYSKFAEIYTLGSGAWRRSKRVPPARHQSLFGIFFNGALHWLVELPNQSVLIRCFDLNDEKFRTIPLPLSTFYEANFIRTHVGVLGDCLCLSSIVASISSVWEIQIWVMKEYGVRESWIKELTIKYPTPWEHWWSLQSTKVVTCLKNGEVVFDCEGCPGIQLFKFICILGFLHVHVDFYMTTNSLKIIISKSNKDPCKI
jgi:F-box interacting protein